MNNLSWLLYLGDICSGLNDLCGFLAFLAFFGTAAMVIAAIGTRTERCEWKFPIWPCVLGPIVFALLCVATVAVPSKDTVYAIAASEMGEQALTSPLGVKAGKALEAWLERQTTPPQAVPAAQ